MITFNSVQELLNRLAKNPLQEDGDLTAYIQYASRIAALGDDTKIKELPVLFAKEPFAGNVIKILKQRCEEGWWDVSEYTGKYLALSLIDAQDFYCFERRFGRDFPELEPYFTKWRQDCEDVEIDDECAVFLKAFIEKFPIPEEERLPVIDTPITEREWMLLEFANQYVELPIVDLKLQPPENGQKNKDWYDFETKKYLKSPVLLQAADDGYPGQLLKAWMQNNGTVEIKDKRFFIETQLDDVWQLHFSIKNEDHTPTAVERVRIGNIPAFQDNKNPAIWNFNLQMFDDNHRRQILEQPIFVQLRNGYRIKCIPPFF
ncbi:MAG: hypothetical protein LBE12_08590 [Planctomycetaceae bacterium]|jgi:hypothetical protein|nr:hypothetical protein [Planctomycetaceae bacterium]